MMRKSCFEHHNIRAQLLRNVVGTEGVFACSMPVLIGQTKSMMDWFLTKLDASLVRSVFLIPQKGLTSWTPGFRARLAVRARNKWLALLRPITACSLRSCWT